MTDLYRTMLILLIACIGALIFIFFIVAVIRRIVNARKYRALDIYRNFYRGKIVRALQSGTLVSDIDALRALPQSLQWRAIEEILVDLIAYRKYRNEIRRAFLRLGYKRYYETKLKSRRRVIKATAIDRLGKMGCELTTDTLIDLLRRERDPEILTITVRSLSRNRTPEGLTGILEQMPDLYQRALVSQKTIEASLIQFGPKAVPTLVAYTRKYWNPKITASLLEVLSHLTPDTSSLKLAMVHLSARDAEIRAKALKVLGRRGVSTAIVQPERLIPLLRDPVWFVKLQAAKAMGSMRYEGAVDMLGLLLLDKNWQVRNTAARALSKIGNASLDVFLNILKCRDRYAKESICEEVERTHFIYRLIENLMSPDRTVHQKSYAILRIMHSLDFSTPLYQYLDRGGKSTIKYEIALMMHQTAQPAGIEMDWVEWGAGS